MKINSIKLKQFIRDWTGRGNEKQDTMKFWIEFLSALSVVNPTRLAEFEKPVIVNGKQKYIDVYLGDVKVLIEQKSLGTSLNAAELQSDGVFLTPYQQGKRYSDNLPFSEKPLRIIACNFGEFRIYDMEQAEPEKGFVSVRLEELEKEAYLFDFLTAFSEEEVRREEEISVKACNYIKPLYEAFLEQYDSDDAEVARNLNILCVRLVFLYYCEDAGIMQKNQFLDYLKASDVLHIRDDIINLFRVLNTRKEDRSKYLTSMLVAFPYCNGGLFKEEIEIPGIDQNLLCMMIEASESFDWKDISPVIFGAMFESTLNPQTRRAGGMHYTSVENIHKVIDPLFLDDLKDELNDILSEPVPATKEAKLDGFQDKIAGLKFLDPACGSGNFLTETYLCLRHMENTVIKEKIALQKKVISGQIVIGEVFDMIKVSVQQFYGIEINDFAVSVAMTALWIAEAQMMKETEEIVAKHLDFLPLETLANIHEENALRIDWESVIPRNELDYIIGNPPFVGYSYQNEKQKSEMRTIFAGNKKAGKLDYVAAWYKKASDLMKDTHIRSAFVSTNSITQGEQVDILWRGLMDMGIHIDFAYRTFKWSNEADKSAAVHCVIIGFSSAFISKVKQIYDDKSVMKANNINGYLLDADNIFVSSREHPVSKEPEMIKGSSPVDGGHFFLSADEYMVYKNDAVVGKFIHKFLGAREFIHNNARWCLWLVDASPTDIQSSSFLKEKIQAVHDFRINSTKEATRRYAEQPLRFMEIRQPENDYILVPRHSSENRRYIPLGFEHPDVICGDANNMVPDATLYHFGIMTSNVHMSWVRTVAGRIKSDYRYSNDIVYNNFPWPTPTGEQKAKIEKTAQGILDARALYPDASLADLYDELTMPIELRKAHQANDRAVMEAYGIGPRDPEFKDEAACVAMLMNMYQKLIEEMKQ